MATTSSQRPSPSPFARLSRFGLGLGLKSQPSPTYSLATKDEGEEDWYIAYNGPYEVPKDTRKRDSWGDIVEDEGRDTILSTDVLRRYGGSSKPSDITDGMRYRRGRAQSATSRVTTISSTTEPSRRSMRSPPRRIGNVRRPPVSSYINLDAAGGVGESPMPPQRSPVSPTSTYPTSTNRTSMSNFFFGRPSTSSSRKSLRSPSTTNLTKHRESRATSPSLRKSTSLDMLNPKNQEPVMTTNTKMKQLDEDDYYNSYYSTLIPTPKSTRGSKSRDERPTTADARLGREPTQSTNLPAPDTQKHPRRAHPYSYAFPTHAAPPQTAPATITRSVTAPMLETKHDKKDSGSSDSHQYHPYPLQTLVSDKPPSGIHLRVVDTLKPSNLSPLKVSVSVPNLRARQQASPPTSPHLPKGMDRWLSAESWCDAMILPRPRFKVKQTYEETDSGSEKRNSGKSSGRIVSPPPTPIARSTDLGQDTDLNEKASSLEQEEQVAPRSSPKLRRKLTKSKSAVNLRSTHASNHPAPAITVSPVGHPRVDSKGKRKLQKQKRRPKDLVLDDSAFQGEPSLDRVLDEGDQLDEERKQWHAQATKSLGNKATRSLSRGRSKSLNHKDSRRHRKDPSYGMGSIDFLTTRTLLGSQGVAPTIIVRPPGSQETRTQSSGTMSSKCHSHTTSHGTQSSQGAHRRNDSWGQHALKLAKYTASGALCGIQDQSQTCPTDEQGAAIEGAIKATDTKVIQLRKQHNSLEEKEFVVIETAPFVPDYAAPVPGATEDLPMGPDDMRGGSPTPSGTTGRGVGIALSTPPASDDHSQETYESMSIPDHPYAQGARYSYHPHQPTALDFSHERIARGSDFAGPHPSSPEMRPLDFNVGANDVSMRHRFPPQATLQSLPHMAHPYAMGSYPAELHTNPEGLVDLDEDEPRDTNFEFDASSERLEHAYTRMSTGNPEPLEVGEALTSFRRQGSRDAIFGLGEKLMEQGQPTTEAAGTRRTSVNSQTWPLRIRRKPVSYADYEDSSPASPEAEATTPPPERLDAPKYRREASSSTAGHSSGSSPQHSPRPLGNVDDLEHFHDLFYKPDQSNLEASATSSLASRKAVPSEASHDIFSVEGGPSRSLRSGLSKLARKLTEEYEDTLAQEEPSDIDAFVLAQSRQRGSLRGQRVPDREFIFSDSSKPRRISSPEPMDPTLPLHLNSEETGPDDDVPEDVESSRASSILERSSMEDDTFGISLRLRAVEAVITPPAVVHDHRDLRPVSLTVDKVEPYEAPNAEEEYQRVMSRSSLAPPVISTDLARSSYMTSTTDGSRMSGLSDFPEPPSVEHLNHAHMSIISSYFGGDTSHKQTEDAPITNNAITPENRRYAANRMTFGGSEDVEEDIEKVGEVVPPSTDV